MGSTEFGQNVMAKRGGRGDKRFFDYFSGGKKEGGGVQLSKEDIIKLLKRLFGGNNGGGFNPTFTGYESLFGGM